MMSPGTFGLTPDLIALSVYEARYRPGYADCHPRYLRRFCVPCRSGRPDARQTSLIEYSPRQVRRPSALRLLQIRERPERSRLPSYPRPHRRSRRSRLQYEQFLIASNPSNTGTTYRCAGDILPVPQRSGCTSGGCTLSWQSGQSVAAARASRSSIQASDKTSRSNAGLLSHRRVSERPEMCRSTALKWIG